MKFNLHRIAYKQVLEKKDVPRAMMSFKNSIKCAAYGKWHFLKLKLRSAFYENCVQMNIFFFSLNGLKMFRNEEFLL